MGIQTARMVVTWQSPAGSKILSDFNMTNRDPVNLWKALATRNSYHIAKQRSKSKLLCGDYFALELEQIGWFLGRVVHDSPAQSALDGDYDTPSFAGGLLIYIYKGFTNSIPHLPTDPTPPILATSPMVIHRELWTKGYAIRLGHSSIRDGELLSTHCFYDRIYRCFYNENGAQLQSVSYPCSDGGLHFVESLSQYLSGSIERGYDQDSHPLISD